MKKNGKANQGRPFQMDFHRTPGFFQQRLYTVLLGLAQLLPHGWDLLGSMNRAKSQLGLLSGDNILTKNSGFELPNF